MLLSGLRCRMSYWALIWIHGEQKKTLFSLNPSSKRCHVAALVRSSHLLSCCKLGIASILLVPLSPSHNFASGMS